ncbi:MAG: hypothetical protein COV75_03005 [Candidatus Omnitrophica bacterium CG11_big_fil_rev_8_21_14_0_20_63_9]|nr:MAG: hypothetical protein COV75_03005 [Candidatus Omnitrophica bacterium CG11_big_fil_rev_8_21_14_0_20_63_9]
MALACPAFADNESGHGPQEVLDRFPRHVLEKQPQQAVDHAMDTVVTNLTKDASHTKSGNAKTPTSNGSQ